MASKNNTQTTEKKDKEVECVILQVGPDPNDTNKKLGVTYEAHIDEYVAYPLAFLDAIDKNSLDMVIKDGY